MNLMQYGELMSAEIQRKRDAYDIVFESVPVYHPKGPHFIATDRLTYDPDPESSWCIHGLGRTKAEALADLIEQLDDVLP
jgi:hypothetical protein